MSEGPLSTEPGRLPPTGVSYADVLPLAITGSASQRLFYPEAGQNFDGSSKQVIRIPLTGAGFLDAQHSLLRFAISAKGAAASQRLAGGAYSWINRLRIEGPDGEEIERIENYNLLHNMLDSATTTYNQHNGVDSVLEGKSQNLGDHTLVEGGTSGTQNYVVSNVDTINLTASNASTAVWTNNNTTAATITSTTVSPTSTNNSKLYMGGATIRGASADFGNKHFFTVKLVSGLLNAKRYIPIGFIRGRGLTLELTLADLNVTFANNTSSPFTDYRISDVQYQAHIMELSSEFNSRFQQMLIANGGIMFHGVSFTNTVTTVTASSTLNIQLPLRARSLKGILISLRDTAKINSATANSFRRMGWGITSYQFFIGSSVYPQNPVQFQQDTLTWAATAIRDVKAEALKEVMKVFARLNDVEYDPMLDASSWVDPYFMLGIDLERFPHDSGVRESGLNTAARADNIELRITCAAGYGNAPYFATDSDVYGGANPAFVTGSASNGANLVPNGGNLRVDSFGQMDVLYQLLPDGTFTSSY